MATSGTYTFAPSNADLFLEAFGRCGIEPPAVLRGHIIHARRSLNFLLTSWANRGVNLWAVDLQTIQLQAPVDGVGVAVYTVPANTVAMLDTYLSIIDGGGPGINTDRIMLPMARDEYAQMPEKLQPGIPTRYWFERIIPPQVTIWQPPLFGADFNVISYYRMRRLQDASPQMGEQPDIEYRFYDALAAELAVRLAEKYAPAMVAQAGNRLERAAKDAWMLAAESNRDDAPMRVQPAMSGYWRV